MKKLSIIILIAITMLTSFGCTRLPASQETGVIPGEYKGLKSLNVNELETENDKLKADLERTTTELRKLKDDYLSIAKNNDLIIGKLNEAESILKQLEDEDTQLPKFYLEQTDKNNIISYIKERRAELSKNFKDVKTITLNDNDDVVLFYTVGYGENYNQIFIWKVGKSEPVEIDGAFFGKEGNWKWLLQDKYILIDSGKSYEEEKEKKILDISAIKIISAFETNTDDICMIPGTSSLIMQKPKTESSAPIYEIYDFITYEEKKLDFEFQDKDLKFIVDSTNNTVNFTGTYTDANDIIYSIKVVMNMDKMIENYSIKTIEQSKEQISNTVNDEDLDSEAEGNI